MAARVPSLADDLLSVLRPIIRRCRPDIHWARTSEGIGFRARPLPEVKWVNHIFGEKGYGLCPILEGEYTTQLALLDMDSHKGDVPWDTMVGAARRICESLAMRGMFGHIWRSSGGSGIHIILVWDSPQDAYSVRSILGEVLEANGLKPGTGGMSEFQVEVFPKQNRVPMHGRGSMFVLPLYRNSLPLGRTGSGVVSKEDTVGYTWTSSAPVPVLDPPQVPERVPSKLGRMTPELADIAAAVDVIPNYSDDGTELDYDSWFRIICAIWDGTGGSEEGRHLCHVFSSKSANKYDPTFFDEEVWPYIRERKEDGITVATLFATAMVYGWSPFSASADDFEDLSADGDDAQEAPTPEPPPPPPPPPPDRPDPPQAGDPEDEEPNVPLDGSEVPEPFPGLVEAIVSKALEKATTKQPELILGAVISGLSAGISGRVSGPTGLRSNTYTLLLAPSGTGKDSALGLASELAAYIGGVIGGAPASGAGLEDLIYSRVGTPDGAADVPIFCVADELARVLKLSGGPKGGDDKGNIRETLMTLYSASHRTHTRRVLATSSRGSGATGPLYRPKLSFIGGSTLVSLQDLLSADDASSGLLARFLVVQGQEKPERVVVWGQTDTTVVPCLDERWRTVLDGIRGLKARLSDQAAANDFDGEDGVQTYCVSVEYSPEARRLREHVERKVWEGGGCADREGSESEHAVYNRFGEHTQKVAITLAVATDPENLVVTGDMYRWAVRYVAWCLRHVMSFLRHHATGNMDVEARRLDIVLKTVRRLLEPDRDFRCTPPEAKMLSDGEVPRGLLLRHSHMAAKTLNEAVGTLLESAQLTTRQISGTGKNTRPVILYSLPAKEEASA